jgi:hypothetical protein
MVPPSEGADHGSDAPSLPASTVAPACPVPIRHPMVRSDTAIVAREAARVNGDAEARPRLLERGGTP